MRFYQFFLTLTLGLFASLLCGMNKTPMTPADRVIPAIIKYSKQLKKNHGIVLTMYGVSSAGPDKIYDGKIHLIDVGFRIDNRMSLEESRKLFFSIVDGMLDIFNSDESFRDGFYRYPVNYEDLYFRLSFDYDHKGYLRKDDVSLIAILENEVMYFIAEEDGANVGLEMKQITSDVGVVTGLSPKTRCITEKLPE